MSKTCKNDKRSPRKDERSSHPAPESPSLGDANAFNILLDSFTNENEVNNYQ